MIFDGARDFKGEVAVRKLKGIAKAHCGLVEEGSNHGSSNEAEGNRYEAA